MNAVKTNSSVAGTSLVGYVRTTYDRLVATFGEPSLLGDVNEKVQAEWVLKFDDGTIATIYDWKNYGDGVPEFPYDWHIGGHNGKAVSRVVTALYG
jgi:hypothetical protein